MAASANNSNLEITYSDNCGEQGVNKSIIAAYPYPVTNSQIHSVTHEYIVVGNTHNESESCFGLIERNIKSYL